MSVRHAGRAVADSGDHLSHKTRITLKHIMLTTCVVANIHSRALTQREAWSFVG